MANELSTKVEEVIQYIVINSGDEQFGIDIRYIDNIVRMQHITRVPKVPSYFKGVINLRGEVLPVMSLRVKMGVPEAPENKENRIIILKMDGHESIGVVVDSVKEVVNIDMNTVERTTSDNGTQFVTGVSKQKEGLISILDVFAVVGE